jgi:Rrf2 family protein
MEEVDIMRLSTRVRYGARALLDIALHLGEGPVSVQQIADRQGVPAKYLEQVLSALQAGGLVRSVRGRHGGYTLVRPPGEITVRDVYVVLEGDEPPAPCADGLACGRSAQCAMRDVWSNMHEAMMGALASATFAELAARVRRREAECAPPMYYI